MLIDKDELDKTQKVNLRNRWKICIGFALHLISIFGVHFVEDREDSNLGSILYVGAIGAYSMRETVH